MCVSVGVGAVLLAHLVYQTKSLYNHALSIVVSDTGIGVTVGISVICVQAS